MPDLESVIDYDRDERRDPRHWENAHLDNDAPSSADLDAEEAMRPRFTRGTTTPRGMCVECGNPVGGAATCPACGLPTDVPF
jgi:rubrerythrin